MRVVVAAALALGLSACSQNNPAPAESAAPTTPAIAEVPTQFQGIWDYVKSRCDPASDMRTEIAERGITFYESHGAVTGLTVESPQRITVDLAMQGEGEKWTMTRTFTLSEGGTILTPTGGSDTGEPMPLKRCA